MSETDVLGDTGLRSVPFLRQRCVSTGVGERCPLLDPVSLGVRTQPLTSRRGDPGGRRCSDSVVETSRRGRVVRSTESLRCHCLTGTGAHPSILTRVVRFTVRVHPTSRTGSTLPPSSHPPCPEPPAPTPGDLPWSQRLLLQLHVSGPPSCPELPDSPLGPWLCLPPWVGGLYLSRVSGGSVPGLRPVPPTLTPSRDSPRSPP